MSRQTTRDLYALIVEVRACFQRLKTVSDAMLGDLGINASTRAVLETVVEKGPISVPDIARIKSVSRQHVQVTVDALTQQDLLTSQDNPAHKRSPLIAATEVGQTLFATVKQRESTVLDSLATEQDAVAVRDAIRTLHTLSHSLEKL